jgi:hypothetical protein
MPEIVLPDFKFQSFSLRWFLLPQARGMDDCGAPKTEASQKPIPINPEL